MSCRLTLLYGEMAALSLRIVKTYFTHVFHFRENYVRREEKSVPTGNNALIRLYLITDDKRNSRIRENEG